MFENPGNGRPPYKFSGTNHPPVVFQTLFPHREGLLGTFPAYLWEIVLTVSLEIINELDCYLWACEVDDGAIVLEHIDFLDSWNRIDWELFQLRLKFLIVGVGSFVNNFLLSSGSTFATNSNIGGHCLKWCQFCWIHIRPGLNTRTIRKIMGVNNLEYWRNMDMNMETRIFRHILNWFHWRQQYRFVVRYYNTFSDVKIIES